MSHILYLGLDPTHYQGNGTITHWPIIQIRPRPLSEPDIQQALANFDAYTHVIITSKSTVKILKEYLELSHIPLERWRAKATLAVGQSTAKSLLQIGITPFKVAVEEKAEGIVELLKSLEGHFFWPHSAKARPMISEFLQGKGARLATCVLYEPVSHFPDPLPDLSTFDEIVFTSPSTVDAFLEHFHSFPKHARLTPIGLITGNYLNACVNSLFGSQ